MKEADFIRSRADKTVFLFCVGVINLLNINCDYKLTPSAQIQFNHLLQKNFLPSYERFTSALTFIFSDKMSFNDTEEEELAQDKLIEWYNEQELKL